MVGWALVHIGLSASITAVSPYLRLDSSRRARRGRPCLFFCAARAGCASFPASVRGTIDVLRFAPRRKFAHGFAHTLWSGGVLNLDRVHRPLLGRPNGFRGPWPFWPLGVSRSSDHRIGRAWSTGNRTGKPSFRSNITPPAYQSILCPSWDENRIRVVRARCGRSGGLSATPTIRPMPLMVSSRRGPRPRDGQLETATQNRGDGEAQP